MTEQLLPADALAKNAPRTILPLAGFWFRLGALLIDIFILRMALQLTYSALRPFYLSLGPGSTVFGLLVAFVLAILNAITVVIVWHCGIRKIQAGKCDDKSN